TGCPDAASDSLTLLEDWGVPSRLASQAGLAGCYEGFVTDLADRWLSSLSREDRSRVTIFSCGPEVMLRAAQAVAQKHSLPSQLCLEEFMACGVGGCAGCTVQVETDRGPAMKRVCVDGPVFDGDRVYPPGLESR
ncbi:MAG: hypothetical protein MI867_06945, partial [Pseudomonadales bacterium]|nr:hypothetical protein [Pseudomonadales bacterium]